MLWSERTLPHVGNSGSGGRHWVLRLPTTTAGPKHIYPVVLEGKGSVGLMILGACAGHTNKRPVTETHQTTCPLLVAWTP